jgi:hypothetical protein
MIVFDLELMRCEATIRVQRTGPRARWTGAADPSWVAPLLSYLLEAAIGTNVGHRAPGPRGRTSEPGPALSASRWDGVGPSMMSEFESIGMLSLSRLRECTRFRCLLDLFTRFRGSGSWKTFPQCLQVCVDCAGASCLVNSHISFNVLVGIILLR